MARRADSVAADLVALQQRAHALQDALNSRRTTVINRRLALLAIVSVVLLPPTLITGIVGMTVDDLPFKDQSYGFVLTVALMAGSVIALVIWLRRLRFFWRRLQTRLASA